MNEILIVKVGGEIIEDSRKWQALKDQLVNIGRPFILVHGGGKTASSLAQKLGLESKMVDGRRITDAAMLEVVVQTYSGTINTKIVADLNASNLQTLGLNGSDLGWHDTVKRSPLNGIDYGYVGALIKVHPERLLPWLNQSISLVVSPILADANGQLLNTNADTIAAEIGRAFASTLTSTKLIYLFDYKGVMLDINDLKSSLSCLSHSEMNSFVDTGIISGGMLPKLENGFLASRSGCDVRIGKFDALQQLIAGTDGTKLEG
jgi:acetylglutamate kinase